ncbi:MAG: prolipoprotein diacylglyceryl transferase [Balneolaceae bacterium]|nr:prolipoprotein diacylglyceryl transferase [Balneolaceae bacterium]MCH8548797.1 prolipoprotein diacylglyceryl transferase [Balneolaceae bacterium]
MDSSNHFTWDADPIIFTLPEFDLPVPISIWGLVLGAILIYFGYQKLKPKPLRKKKPAPEPEFWKVALMSVGALVVAQIPFLFISSPSFETFGGFEPRWYGLMFAMAFISGYMITGKTFHDAGRSQEDLDRLLIYVLIATIVGARLGHVFFYEAEFYLRNIHLIPQVWTGGLASHGAAIGIIIAMYLYAKKTHGVTFMWVADRVVPGVAIGGMFIRIGNFFNSEIIGQPTDSMFGIIFERIDMVPRHPSMLYESFSTLIVLSALIWIYKKYENNPPQGSLFGTFLVLLFTGRFLIEFTKETQADFLLGATLDMGQLLSVPFVLVGIWLLWKKVNWSKAGAPMK